MSIEGNKKVVLRFNKEFLEGGDPNILEEIVADNFINHTAPAGFPNDASGLIQFVAILHKGFSDLHIEIHEQVAEGDIVASRKTMHAIHSGEIMGHKATGKKVTIKVMDFVRVEKGKYVDHWGQNNITQVIQEL